jgi:hypothetical protein
METQNLKHRTHDELIEGLEDILNSPTNHGRLDLIVRRPEVDQREVLQEGQLDLKYGLLGDTWINRSSSRTPDKSAHPDMQLNIMNSRVIELIAIEKERWKWAGDQLYMDLNISESNTPPGTKLKIGEAIIEVSSEPHTGCKKFVERFGLEAMKFVNAKERKHLHLRGINAKVLKEGRIKTGDIVEKL